MKQTRLPEKDAGLVAEILGSVRYLDSSPVANAQFFLLQNRTIFHYTEQSWNDLGLGLASLFAGTYYARRVAAPVNAPHFLSESATPACLSFGNS